MFPINEVPVSKGSAEKPSPDKPLESRRERLNAFCEAAALRSLGSTTPSSRYAVKVDEKALGSFSLSGVTPKSTSPDFSPLRKGMLDAFCQAAASSQTTPKKHPKQRVRFENPVKIIEDRIKKSSSIEELYYLCVSNFKKPAEQKHPISEKIILQSFLAPLTVIEKDPIEEAPSDATAEPKIEIPLLMESHLESDYIEFIDDFLIKTHTQKNFFPPKYQLLKPILEQAMRDDYLPMVLAIMDHVEDFDPVYLSALEMAIELDYEKGIDAILSLSLFSFTITLEATLKALDLKKFDLANKLISSCESNHLFSSSYPHLNSIIERIILKCTLEGHLSIYTRLLPRLKIDERIRATIFECARINNSPSILEKVHELEPKSD